MPARGAGSGASTPSLGIAASALLLAMMLLTFVDVVARYLFNRPIRGAFEVTELLLLVLIFAGLPLVSHADEHVDDGLHRPHAAGARVRGLDPRWCSAVCAAFMFLLAWQVWIKADRICGLRRHHRRAAHRRSARSCTSWRR